MKMFTMEGYANHIGVVPTEEDLVKFEILGHKIFWVASDLEHHIEGKYMMYYSEIILIKVFNYYYNQ